MWGLSAAGRWGRFAGGRWGRFAGGRWGRFAGGRWGRYVELWSISPHDAVRPQTVEEVLELIHPVWFDVVEADGEVAQPLDALKCARYTSTHNQWSGQNTDRLVYDRTIF